MTQTTPRAMVTDKVHAAPNDTRTRYDVTNTRTGEALGFLARIGPACWQAYNACGERVGDSEGYLEPRLAMTPLVAAYRTGIIYEEDRA
jgi:hypothetical protein